MKGFTISTKDIILGRGHFTPLSMLFTKYRTTPPQAVMLPQVIIIIISSSLMIGYQYPKISSLRLTFLSPLSLVLYHPLQGLPYLKAHSLLTLTFWFLYFSF